MKDKKFNPADTPPLFGSALRNPAWRAPAVSELPQWPVNGRVAIDIETFDPNLKSEGPGVRRNARVVGFSFAIDGGPSRYVGLHHEASGNVANPDAAWRYLRDQAHKFRGELVGANMQYDLDFLAQMGVHFCPLVRMLDVQVADPLINELQNSYSLQSIAERWGLGGKDESQLTEAAQVWGVEAKSGLWKLPADLVERYAIGDVELPLRIMRKQEEEIKRQELVGIFDLECKVLPVLLKMRRRGIAVDSEKLDYIEQFAREQAYLACVSIKEQTGIKLNPEDVMKKRLILPILESIGATKEAVNDAIHSAELSAEDNSLDKEFLSRIKHPAAASLLRARKFFKISTTYVDGVRRHTVNGRVHPTFNQMRGDWSGGEDGARFGRMSSSSPNLQNQPKRDDEIGAVWRSIYIPDKATSWVSCDYSGQEPRLLAHYAEACGCDKAKQFAQMFRDDPNLDVYGSLSTLTGTKRNDTKTIYLGLSYSMGPAKLCRTLKLPTRWVVSKKTGKLVEIAGEQGESLFKAFHVGAPFVGQMAEIAQNKAQSCGFIKTILGRRCRFPANERFNSSRPESRWNPRYDWGNKALNRLIQGSAADQTKKALVDLDDAGIPVQLQIHDEITASLPDVDSANHMARIMRDAVKLNVPMRVEAKVGKSWGET